MQTMNTDQPPFYPNPAASHQAPAGYYMQNPMGQPTYQGGPRMTQSYNAQMNNNFAASQLYYQPAYQQNPVYVQTNGPRAMNPAYTTIIRPSNENPNGAQPFIPSAQYPNNSIYTGQYPQYQMPHMYTQAPVPTQISNQPQAQYTVVNNQHITQSPPSSQQSSDSQHGQASQSSQPRDRRERKPLVIVNPDSKQPVDVPVPTVIASPNIPAVTTTDENAQTESVTNSTIPNSKSSEDINKISIQEKFRQQVAQLLKPNTETDKNANQTSTEETSTENLAPQSTSSRPTSRSGSMSTKPSELQPSYPGIRTGSIAEDKSNVQDDVEQQIEIVVDDLKSTPTDTTDTSQNETNESFEIITSAQLNDSDSEAPTLGKTPSLSKRFDYTIEELRNKRSNPVSQERPIQLPEIPGVTTPRQPKPKVDGDDRFLREVRSILNKLTPQTYDVLVTKLEGLELNSAKRLEGMITVVFVKAVEAAIFCSLYAKLCKHFEKKQVTVPDENGQLVKHYFRQLLLSRCQKEFENDYRQEIRYEQRKIEVDAMTDEKAQREAAENLEEDFLKAKRKKLGNIIFIGELFKLHMLIDTIMYDCIEYLLKDKADEEGLECLCRLLRTIGKELEIKASEKAANKKNLEKNFLELESISTQKQTSSRIRFMIQDTFEQRKADWVARRAEVKPMTIDEIHETERLKREEQDRERNQRRDNRPSGGGGGGGNNPPQYTGRGSRGSGMKQQSNRNDADRSDNRLVVNSIRQFQTNDKRNQGLPFSLAPQGAWSRGAGSDKKTEDDRANAAKTGKPPLGANQQFRPNKPGTPPGTPSYGVQRQPSRELARESSQRDRENAMQSLRKTTNQNEPTSPKNISRTDSRDGSRNVSREQSRNPSRESSVNERVIPTTKPTTTEPLNEEKTQARVVSLIKEYTENYSDSDERPVNEAIEDLITFCTDNIDQQGIIVRELFTNVLEAKSRARKAVGHLLDAALQKNIISTEGFLSGIKLFVEVVPDYAVDIPLIWQYIGEIIGALIGAPSSNMLLLKSLLPLIPEDKSKQLFQYIIRYAVEFSSKATIQKFWQSANLSLNDLFKSDLIDSSFTNEYNWLSETTSNKEKLTPNADPQLVKLFKSINDQNTTVNDDQILSYIQENIKPDDKFYIRKIVLSYLEACLIIRDSQKKIQEDIAKNRMTILKTIIDKLEHEIQAVYAIQNFIDKLEHPSKMARLLFDIFYDEECISEEAFFEWRKLLDPSEHEGHSVVELSTRDFFTWLQQAEEEEEEEE